MLVDTGIRSRTPELVQADDVHVDAVDVGIDTGTGTGNPFVVSGSTVHALESVRGELTERGTNDLSLPPLNLLGAIGIPLILLAVLLQQVYLVRRRRTGEGAPRWSPPALPDHHAAQRDATGRRVARALSRRAQA
jgi:hypothetical protein